MMQHLRTRAGAARRPALLAVLPAAALLALLAASARPGFAQKAESGASEGTIAYVRGGKTPGDEIRLIRPDGTGDRQIWHVPAAISTGVTGISWRPDGKEIAFSSDHDAAASVYDSNIYVLRPDGTGLRRLTDPPGAAGLSKYPRGRVVVTVANPLTDKSLFLVYVSGAPAPVIATIPAGGRKTLTFDSVADFGPQPHAVVAVNGMYRWLLPLPAVHAGQTLNAGTLNITPHGLRSFGLSGPTWSHDGRKVGCVLGDGANLVWVPADPAPGALTAAPLVGGAEPVRATSFDLGPTPATADEILYGGGVGNYAFRRTKQGSGAAGAALLEYAETELPGNVAWLPDASGFLFAKSDFTTANIYRYDFATKQVTQLTHFDGEFAMNFGVSPDGRRVVFERRSGDAPSDLWVMRIDGSDQRLLVKRGAAPVWGR